MADSVSGDEYPYRVDGHRRVTPAICELHLAPEDEVLRYRAGQYVLLCDPDHDMPPRSYSVANAPRPDGGVSLLVTHVPGGPTSGWIHERLSSGSRVVLTGPYGTFVADPDGTGPVLLLAAGSGLAPARALAEVLRHGPSPRPVTLFFSARSRRDAIDHGRWREWARTDRHFRYLLTLTREPDTGEDGRIPDLLARTFRGLAGWEVFASGPPRFVAGCAAAARALGAAPDAIRTEEFFIEPPRRRVVERVLGGGVPETEAVVGST